MNIVLTGFMGTGKSAVGSALAARLGHRFVDTDDVIVRRHGPIAMIFEDLGEPTFRAMERRVAIEVARASGLVVAAGGGMVLDRRNVRALSASGVIVCLTASASRIVERTAAQGLASRPLLAGPDPVARVAALMGQRASTYARFPQVRTDGRSVDAVAQAVMSIAVGDSGPFGSGPGSWPITA